MSMSDDFKEALKELIANVGAYRDDLRSGGHKAEAGRVAKAHGDLLREFGHLNAAALESDLNQAAAAKRQLETITAEVEQKTRDLAHNEAMVKWVVDIASDVVKVILATTAGGPPETIAGAVGGLWTIWNNKPA